MSRDFAYIFPGQGSQAIGMGRHLYESGSAAARAVLAEVDEALGESLSDLMFAGAEETLTLTANAQPALMAVSVAVVSELEARGFILAEHGLCFAGHSLGEYSALVAARSLALGDAARLLRLRGEAMQAACAPGCGAMAAILAATIEQTRSFAEEAAAITGAVCSVANDNAPGQAVISGAAKAVDEAMAIAKAAGIKRCILLPVSAPFHCALMQPAAEAMRAALAEITLTAPSLPIIANVTASAQQDPQTIKAGLVEQVTAPVRWRESMETLAGMGVRRALECGSGQVLCGLIKRSGTDINCRNLQTPEDIEIFLNGLADESI